MVFIYFLLLFCILSTFSQNNVIGQVAPFTCKAQNKNITNKQQDLKNCLFKDYNPKSVPLTVDQKHINIDLAFTLEDIYFADISSEAIYYILLEMNWTDPFLNWNPEDYGNISSLILTGTEANSKLWTPMFSNDYLYSFNRKESGDLFSISKLEFSSKGNVLFRDFISLNNNCDGDLTEFPFDSYYCFSMILSDDLLNQVIFQFTDKDGKKNNKTNLDISLYTKNHLQILDSSVIIQQAQAGMEADGLTATSIQFMVELERKSGSHIIAFHLPAIGFLLFLLLPLWIAGDSFVRFVFPITVMYGSMFQVNVISNLIRMPSSQYNGSILLVSFYRDLMLLSLCILVESMFIALLWSNKSLPDKLRRFYYQINMLPVIRQMIAYTLFDKKILESDAQVSKEEIEPDVPTLKCTAIMIDRGVFCVLFFVEVFMYWDLLPSDNLSNYKYL